MHRTQDFPKNLSKSFIPKKEKLVLEENILKKSKNDVNIKTFYISKKTLYSKHSSTRMDFYKTNRKNYSCYMFKCLFPQKVDKNVPGYLYFNSYKNLIDRLNRKKLYSSKVLTDKFAKIFKTNKLYRCDYDKKKLSKNFSVNYLPSIKSDNISKKKPNYNTRYNIKNEQVNMKFRRMKLSSNKTYTKRNSNEFQLITRNTHNLFNKTIETKKKEEIKKNDISEIKKNKIGNLDISVQNLPEENKGKDKAENKNTVDINDNIKNNENINEIKQIKNEEKKEEKKEEKEENKSEEILEEKNIQNEKENINKEQKENNFPKNDVDIQGENNKKIFKKIFEDQENNKDDEIIKEEIIIEDNKNDPFNQNQKNFFKFRKDIKEVSENLEDDEKKNNNETIGSKGKDTLKNQNNNEEEIKEEVVVEP